MKVAIEVSSIELVALRKLALVSKVLATKLSGSARQEQDALARVLSDVVDRIDIAALEAKRQ